MPRHKCWIDGSSDFDILETPTVKEAAETFAAQENISSPEEIWMESRGGPDDSFWEKYSLAKWKGEKAGSIIFFWITDEIEKLKPREEDPALYNQYPSDEYEETDK